GSFIQRYPFTTRAIDAANLRASFTAGGTEFALRSGVDYFARPGARGSFAGEIVVAGAEIPAAGREALRGRAVMVVPAAVPQNQALARMRGAADSAGAGAVILVLPADFPASAIAASASAMGPAGTIPMFMVTQERARAIVAASGQDLDAIVRAGAPVTLRNTRGTLNAAVAETVHRVPNVAGILEGSDPELKNTYVIFSAHFDHVGSNCRGVTPQDNICNGADDDASGTSAIMELAEAFAMLPIKPKRSIIFLAVSAEEKGLLGSRYYADNPTVPIESIVANVNIDMIGRNNPDSVVVIGKDYSSLGPLLERINAQHPELRMTTSDDLWPEQRFFFRSDHFNFARREVPAIFFFTGTHEDYHAATDHVEKIDLDKITRITRLIFHYAHAIANDTERPTWVPAGLEEVRRLTTQGR
ncbi:MAG TPA: M20/M25/M40 family metallo-hydrolase, partial [Longimicrobiales bacterium]|nr:M20/M25/M40 family metallo-hydrolase [Longimicrobiales bacterium]